MKQLLKIFRIILCRTSHPGNIGAVARAMKTMDFADLYLVKPKSFPDEIATKRATNAVDILENCCVVENLVQAIQDCNFVIGFSARERDLNVPLITLPKLLENIKNDFTNNFTNNFNNKIALVFGNETNGLSNEELVHCQCQVKIDTSDDFASLNLGSAVQIITYELREFYKNYKQNCISQKNSSKNSNIKNGVKNYSRLATMKEMENFYNHLQQCMQEVGFYNPNQPGRLMHRLRRLFSRSNLESTEINILRGFLSAIQNPTKFGKQN